MGRIGGRGWTGSGSWVRWQAIRTRPRRSPNPSYWAGGLAGGFDIEVSEQLNLGLAVESGRLSVSVPTTSENAAGTYLQGGVYGLWNDGPWHAGATLLGGKLWLDTTTQTGTARYGIGFATLAGELGYGFALDGITVTPEAGLKLIGVFGDPFTEAGSPLALAGQASSYLVAQPSLGVAVSTEIDIDGGVLTPQAFARIVGNLGDHSGSLNAALASGGTSFVLSSGTGGSFGAEFGGGLTLTLDTGATLSADYRGALTAGAIRHSADLSLKVPF